jgi:small conductance mechanosensitive channel
MPGKSVTVERELRWRIKRAFDAASIRIVGGATAVEDAEDTPDPTATVAAPSVYSNADSPQSAAASPIVTQRPAPPAK